MKRNLKVFALVLCFALFAGMLPTFAAVTTSPKPDAEAYSAYHFTTALKVTGTKWYQSGTIAFKNTSNETLYNWVYTFDANAKLNRLENVIYTVKPLSNGWYRYTVSAPTWQVYKKNQAWTHQFAVTPGETVEFKVSGNEVNSIQGLKLTNCIISDDIKKPIVVEDWKLKGAYVKGQIIKYQGAFYTCRQAHTAFATNWTPVLAPALWGRVNKPPYVIVETE